MKQNTIDDKFASVFNCAFDLEMSKPNEAQIIDVWLHECDLNRVMNSKLTDEQIEILNAIPIRLDASYLKKIKEK